MPLFKASTLALLVFSNSCSGDSAHKQEIGQIVEHGGVEELGDYFKGNGFTELPDYTYDGDFTLLHIAASSNKRPKMTYVLLEAGADIFAEDYRNRIPFLVALDTGNLAAIGFL